MNWVAYTYGHMGYFINSFYNPIYSLSSRVVRMTPIAHSRIPPYN